MIKKINDYPRIKSYAITTVFSCSDWEAVISLLETYEIEANTRLLNFIGRQAQLTSSLRPENIDLYDYANKLVFSKVINKGE